MITNEQKKIFQNTISAVLVALADLDDLEKRAVVLKETLNNLYTEIDDGLDKESI